MINVIRCNEARHRQIARKIAAVGLRCSVLVLLALALRASDTFAACHVVTPTGSGAKSGADWNNAMAGISNNLVRGDSYYLGPGNYGGFSHSEALSGSLDITIKRAYIADHCTDAGYVDAAHGQPGGQAVFTGIWTYTGHWVFDGNYPNRKPTTITETGIYVDGTGCTSSNCWTVSLSQTGSANSNFVIRNLAIQGGGDAKADTNPDQNIRVLGPASNYLVQYVMVYRSSNTPILLRAVTNFVVDHSLIEQNITTPANHGECISDSDSDNITISFNTFKNTSGTGCIVELNAGTASTASNWNIYGNLFFSDPATRGGYGNGVVSCINNQSASNWKFFNNTIANIGGSLSTRLNFGTGSGNCIPSGIVAYNNLWYNSVRADHTGPITTGYNTYVQMTSVTDQGTQTIDSATGANPFVSDVNENYHLRADTNLTPINLTNLSGLASLALNLVLGDDVDIDGVKRTTSRGAYQYLSSASSSAPAPPVLNQPIVQ